MDQLPRHLILVKHAMPTIDPGASAAEWRLSDEGRRSCIPLAARLSEFQPTVVVASTEPKASETARIVATELNLPYETQDGVHEHDQTGTSILGDQEWRAAVARFFASPDELVLGRETAAASSDRFANAVATTLSLHPDATPAIVTHGRVMSLFIARTNPIDPFAVWQRLGLPSFVVLSLSELQIVDVVETIT